MTERERCAICDRPEAAMINSHNQNILCPSCVVASGFHMCGHSKFLIKAAIRGRISRWFRRNIIDRIDPKKQVTK